MVWLSSFFLSVAVSAQTLVAPPHMDLQMTSWEYQTLLQQQAVVFALIPKRDEDQLLDLYLGYGQRTLQWLQLVNAGRPPENLISLSSSATLGGNSPSNPSALSMRSVQERWTLLRQVLPAAYRAVIFEDAAIPVVVPGTDREFIEWLRQVDLAYQLAARLKLLLPYKEYLIQAARQDVRGYLHLRDEPGVDTKLAAWNRLPASQKRRWTVSLVRLCMNSGRTDEQCSQELDTSIVGARVLDFKAKYFPIGQQTHDRFFQLAAIHPDVDWKSDEMAEFPFLNPGAVDILDFLQVNIEDEWRWGPWNLKMKFLDRGPSSLTHIRFVPGATPHVNGIAGNQIVMDRNAPLSEYEVQWTIRHEFGHILGFVDCYIEFYDLDLEAIVSYQLDLTNLMCSRRGKILETHFNEMKRGYGGGFSSSVR